MVEECFNGALRPLTEGFLSPEYPWIPRPTIHAIKANSRSSQERPPIKCFELGNGGGVRTNAGGSARAQVNDGGL